MNIIKILYRIILPESFRWKIIRAKKKKIENSIKNNILSYYNLNPSNDSEINKALDYLKSNDLSVFPYDFFNDYKSKEITVLTDPDTNFPYVLHNSKKLFFKKSWTKDHIIDAYRFLLAEQDSRSAHCYITDTYNIKDDSIVVDVGAAEGIFAINDIDKIKHLYLVETDVEWIEVLKETFKPWSEKITIINKFISNKNDDLNMTLDSYFKNIKIDFLKIDVDGAEADLILGADYVISNNSDKVAICTYHKTNDNDDFIKFLDSKKFNLENSEGYMLFYFDQNFIEPFFRRGLIRAYK